MKRAGFVALWVVASFATALVAWGAVRLAGDQVADRPVAPLSADEVAGLLATSVPTLPSTTAPAAATTATTRPPATTTTRTPTTTSTTATTTRAPAGTTPPTTTGTARTAPSTTTTATAPAASTTTTAPPQPTTTAPSPVVQAYQLAGGSVVISSQPGQVSLVSASPGSGYAMEIDSSGPAEVRVRFESSEAKSELRARWRGGTLDVEIDED